MGISWFWFLGASYPDAVVQLLQTSVDGDQTVVTVLLATFSIGIAVGSLLCERLSGRKVSWPGALGL